MSLWHKLPIIIKILLFCLLQIPCNPSKSSILKTFRFKFPWQILANYGKSLPPLIYTTRFEILTSLSATAFYRTAVADEKYFYHYNLHSAAFQSAAQIVMKDFQSTYSVQ